MKRTIVRFTALIFGAAAFLGIPTTSTGQPVSRPAPQRAVPTAATTAPLACATLPTPVASPAPTASENTGSGSGLTVATLRVEAGVVVQVDSAGEPTRIRTNYRGAPKCAGVRWAVLQAGAANGTPANLALINKTLAVTDLNGDWSTGTWHEIG